jgi:hypothetical protein
MDEVVGLGQFLLIQRSHERWMHEQETLDECNSKEALSQGWYCTEAAAVTSLPRPVYG